MNRIIVFDINNYEKNMGIEYELINGLVNRMIDLYDVNRVFLI